VSSDIFSKDEKPAIKILGASGGKSKKNALTSLQISDTIVIDAGNLIDGLGESASKIEHIFLTHMHLDHIVDIPFLLDNIYDIQTKPIKIFAQKESIKSLQQHILNWEIWPDFSQINMKNSTKACIGYMPIEINNTITIDEIAITPIENNHTPFSNGFVIQKGDSSLLFTSDTYCCDSIWDLVNNDLSISTVIIEISFPSNFEQLAKNSKHLTPKILKQELKKLQRDDITIHINHLKPTYEKELKEEIEKERLLLNNGSILKSGDIIYF